MTLLCHFLTQTCCLWAPLVYMTVWDTAGAPHPHHDYRALCLCRMLFICIYIWGKAVLLFGHAWCFFWRYVGSQLFLYDGKLDHLHLNIQLLKWYIDTHKYIWLISVGLGLLEMWAQLFCCFQHQWLIDTCVADKFQPVKCFQLWLTEP